MFLYLQVTKSEYKDCNIDANSKPVAVINCSTPHQKRLYTLTFSSFLPIPNALEFKKGETYYFISKYWWIDYVNPIFCCEFTCDTYIATGQPIEHFVHN